MMKLKQLLWMIAFITAVSACNAPEAESTATAEPLSPTLSPDMATALPSVVPPLDDENTLAGTQWILDSFGPVGAETPVLAETAVTLTFDATGQAGGSGGCNSFGADYQVQGNTLIFGDIVSTMMACTQAGVTEQEQLYLAALNTAGEFEQTAQQLNIYYDNGQGVLNFVQAGAVIETPASDSGSSSANNTSSPENPTRITFDPGETGAIVTATIAEHTTHLYVLQAMEGQDMNVEIISPNSDVLLTVVGEDGTPLKRYQNGPPSWTSQLPATQDYYLHAVSVGPATSYTLTVQIDPLASDGFPPEQPTRITFGSGESSAEIGPTTIVEHDTHYYVLQAMESQEMTVEITSPDNNVVLTIVTEDGMPIKRYQNGPPAFWTGTLPATQDYYIYVISFGPTTPYTLYVQVDPL